MDILATSQRASDYIAKGISDAFKRCLKPPPRLNLVEWADTYRMLPAESSSEAGRWKTDRVIAAKKPMLSVSDPSVQQVTVMACTQLAKALALDTPILTVDHGWLTMGEIEVGDRIFGADGEPTTVLHKSPVYRDHDCYEVEFSDGSLITADGGHRWTVDDNIHRNSTQRTVTITTEEIAETYKNKHGRNRYAIPVAKPLVYSEKNLPVDPYFLGLWLGEGHSYSTRLTMCEDDLEVLDYLTEKGLMYERKPSSSSSSSKTREYRIFDDNRLAYRMTDLGLIKGSNPRNKNNYKHIPEIYLEASIEQRIELLKGLMDSDGTITKKGHLSFTQKCEFLSGDVFRLMITLGLKPRMAETKVSFKGVKSTASKITFTCYDDFPVFKLKRKLERMLGYKNSTRKSETNRRRIVRATKVKPVPVQCIAVDAPDHLFLCGENLIPTHNTELILNTIGFYIHQEPSPIIVMQPKKEMAEAFSKDRLSPMCRESPVLTDAFSDNRRGAGNTILHKQFAGGQITMVGSNSPADLAMRPCRIVLCDETDKYPVSAGEEGDPITLLWERAATFGKKRKLIVVCSPTVEGKSRIEKEYLASDMRVFQHKCPHCEDHVALEWENVNIPKCEQTGRYQPEKASIACPSCGTEWSEQDRHYSIKHHQWKITAPHVTNHHGYRISKFASPWETITELAAKFVKVKDDIERLKAFYNTQMARTWRERGDQPDWKRMYDTREDYKIGVIPEHAYMITCGIDVQKKYLAYEVVAWGRKKQSWSIDRGAIDGSIEDEETREKLTIFLDALFKNKHGIEVPIERVCIDSGYNTQEVYSFVRNYGSERVVAVKGDDNLRTVIGTPRPVDVNYAGQKISRGIMLWSVGSSVIKEQLYRWFNLERPTDERLEAGAGFPTGFCHFPQYDEEFFKQLTAEQYVHQTDNKGYSRYIWEKLRKDNHYLDCRVYARAAAAMLQIDRMTDDDWDARAAYLLPTKETEVVHQAVAEPSNVDVEPEKVVYRDQTGRTRKRGNWIKRR